MTIQSRPLTKEYDANYDRIFRKDKMIRALLDEMQAADGAPKLFAIADKIAKHDVKNVISALAERNDNGRVAALCIATLKDAVSAEWLETLKKAINGS